jgi:BolA protein
MRASVGRVLDATVEAGIGAILGRLAHSVRSKSAYMGLMTGSAKGPVAAEIEKLLHDALAPERLDVIDDSEKHRGHAGHDPRGESHFTVRIVSAAFAGQNRVARQRMVNAALGELLRDRVHALAMVTKAPGEA